MKSKTNPQKISNVRIDDRDMIECKEQILLRSVPCEVVQVINRKKIEIMNNNPHRTQVSNSEAIFKLILKK
jgi:hypothetical protein